MLKRSRRLTSIQGGLASTLSSNCSCCRTSIAFVRNIFHLLCLLFVKHFSVLRNELLGSLILINRFWHLELWWNVQITCLSRRVYHLMLQSRRSHTLDTVTCCRLSCHATIKSCNWPLRKGWRTALSFKCGLWVRPPNSCRRIKLIDWTEGGSESIGRWRLATNRNRSTIPSCTR